MGANTRRVTKVINEIELLESLYSSQLALFLIFISTTLMRYH